MDFLFQIDSTILHWINQVATTEFLDSFFLLITNLHKFALVRYVMIPVLLIYAFKAAGLKALKSALILAVTVGACDLLNHRMIKPAVGRERPFQSQTDNVQLRLPYIPGGYSFPSNHAVNTMAGAMILSAYLPQLKVIALAYTFLVGYSRPYLGVHYPSDILFGWLLGWGIATLILFLVGRYLPSWAPRKIGAINNA